MRKTFGAEFPVDFTPAPVEAFMTHFRSVRFYLVALLLIAGCCLAAFAQAPNRLTRAIDENEVVTLQGNIHALAQPANDQGTVSGSKKLSKMILNLQPSEAQETELEALLAEQQNPESPLYHKWLTPSEFGSRFGISASDLAKIKSWLTSHGFTIDEVTAGNRQILFSGTAAQVANTFHTEIHTYNVNGTAHIANSQDPQIPAALSGVIGGVVSLHDFRRTANIRTRTAMGAVTPGTRPQWTSGSSHYLFPGDWATIYDVNSVYSSYKGTGVNIAVVGRTNINISDVTSFRSAAGLTTNNPSVVIVNTNPGLVSGDQDEATLDVEWAGAIAPAATVKLYAAASTSTTDGIDLSAQYIVNHVSAPIMTTSYGECEYYLGATEMAFYNNLWKQAASEGISTLISSGDSGAAGCEGGSSSAGTRAGVNGLCSSQYSTCVGGTEFNEGSATSTYWSSSNSTGYESALSYIPEKVWNESSLAGGSGLWASGGGASIYYSQPSYQSGITGTSAANGMRAVPDVAFTAAGHDGYVIVENGSYYVIGGTSAASPAFASMLALLVQAQGAATAGLGNINTKLYTLPSASKNPFHATPTGNNTVSGVTGFTASGNTYNLATGLGSIDGALLLSAWGGSSTTSGVDFSMTASATSGSVLTGKSTTFTISVTESGTSKAVALTATAPTGVTVTISPTSITPGTTATVTVTAAASTTLTSASVVVTGKDTSGSQTATYALTITKAPTLAIAATSSSLSLTQGSTATDALTITTGGSYTGNLTFTASGLPTGVTAAWTSNPITGVTGSASTSQTLKLTATSTATVSSVNITVTVAGDGLTATQTVALKVVAPPSLTVTPASTSLTLNSGTTSKDNIALAVNASFSGTVTLSISGLPTGVTATWSSNPVTLSNLAATPVLTLTAASTITTTTTSTATITATGGGLTVTKQITLKAQPSPTLAAATASLTPSVVQGSSVTDLVSLSTNSTFSGTVALTISGMPTGVTATWSANPVTISSNAGTSTLTLKAASTTTVGSYTITITAVGSGLTVTKQITLKVTQAPGVQVIASAASVTMSHTSSTNVTVTTSMLGGLTAPVGLATSGLPSGVTATFSSSSIASPGAGGVTLIFKGSTTAKAGSYTVTITAAVSATSTTAAYTATKTLTLVLQ